MSDDQAREVLDMHLYSVLQLESMCNDYEGATAEELHDRADELTEELKTYPARFSEDERRDTWRDIDELRAAASWIGAEIPDHDRSTSYVESYLRDALDIEIHGKYDREHYVWQATAAHVLISFGGPTVWITGPHGADDDMVEVCVSWWGDAHTARTYAPNLAAYLEILADSYNYAGAPR